MTAKIQVRRDTTANWATDPVLADGEIGFDKTLRALKVGDGSTAWSSLSWLTDTLPYLTSAQTDFNHAEYSRQGRYLIAVPTSFSNIPVYPENMTLNDGSAVLVVVRFDTSVIQILTTRGYSGSPAAPSKVYLRRYDGTNWFGWEPLNTWAVSATEATNIDAFLLRVKSDSTLDGNATIAGTLGVTGAVSLGNTLTVNGTINAGDAAGDRVIVRPSTSVSVPTIAFNHGGVTKMGVGSQNSTTVELTYNDDAKVQLAYGSNTIFTRMNINLDPDGAGLNTNYINGIGAPVGPTGIARLKDTTASSLVVMLFNGGDAATFLGSDGYSEWTATGWGTANTRIKPKAGGVWATTKWVGLAVLIDTVPGSFLNYQIARPTNPFDDNNTNCITFDTSGTGSRIIAWLTQYFP
jgi:hypothetical protein